MNRTTPNSNDICFFGDIEADEMLRAYKLAWRDTWQMRFRHPLYIGFFLFGTAVGTVAMKNGDIGFASLLYVFALLAPIDYFWRKQNLRRKINLVLKHGIFSNANEVVVNDDGVFVGDNSASAILKWEKFVGFRINDEMVVYYISYPITFVTLFRRMLVSPHQWDQLISLSKQHLKET